MTIGEAFDGFTIPIEFTSVPSFHDISFSDTFIDPPVIYHFRVKLRSVVASFPSKGEPSQRPSQLSTPGLHQSVCLLSAVL